MDSKTYTVYILECADGAYYTGVTSEVEERLRKHNEGAYPNCYTFKRRPVSLVYTAEFNVVQAAIEFEKQVKGWSRKKKAALIDGDLTELHLLAQCKNQTSHLNRD